MMGWMSYSKWLFLALAAAATLIGNSFALECHECDGGYSPCKIMTCPEALKKVEDADTLVCLSAYPEKVGGNNSFKSCSIPKLFTQLIGGIDKCKKVPGSKIKEVNDKNKQAFRAAVGSGKITQEEYSQMMLEEQGGRSGSDPFAITEEHTVCICNTDLCNSDEEDVKKAISESETPTKKSASSKSDEDLGGEPCHSHCLSIGRSDSDTFTPLLKQIGQRDSDCCCGII